MKTWLTGEQKELTFQPNSENSSQKAPSLTVPVTVLLASVSGRWSLRTDFLNAVYFRRGLTCTLWLTNDLIDSGQPRAKPYHETM